jgi:hypothetical protein
MNQNIENSANMMHFRVIVFAIGSKHGNFYVCNMAIFTRKNVSHIVEICINQEIIRKKNDAFLTIIGSFVATFSTNSNFYVCNMAMFNRKFLVFALKSRTIPGT